MLIVDSEVEEGVRLWHARVPAQRYNIEGRTSGEVRQNAPRAAKSASIRCSHEDRRYGVWNRHRVVCLLSVRAKRITAASPAAQPDNAFNGATSAQLFSRAYAVTVAQQSSNILQRGGSIYFGASNARNSAYKNE